jgi:hypothetical protein
MMSPGFAPEETREVLQDNPEISFLLKLMTFSIAWIQGGTSPSLAIGEGPGKKLLSMLLVDRK